uniref:N-acetyltransferase domain-containing protein n=1 Tax=Pseudictyota dubia TaxID=2749911 RepID=A0A7R9VLL4_9STRA|mmetsp:Transcript_18046/g.33632  ORF Transcript_18046/g.33632 Transcript_18046/m.33632 type:complete len:213 (+) Transcript_18046:60-698(+)
MNIKIRRETSDDYRKVEEVARDAFWNLYCPGCNEHVIIHKLRKSTDFIRDLTFVIEVDGEIVGSIFYSTSKVIGKDGTEYPTITFGPVCIHPRLHRKGLGRKLITYSIEEAKKKGHKAILIQGYPYHYEPYGFVGAKKYGISLSDGKFYKGLLALPLFKGAFHDVEGHVEFAEVFDPSEDETASYDGTFPTKEKGFQQSQKEFEIACQQLDE